jgi:hypothetical protein
MKLLLTTWRQALNRFWFYYQRRIVRDMFYVSTGAWLGFAVHLQSWNTINFVAAYFLFLAVPAIKLGLWCNNRQFRLQITDPQEQIRVYGRKMPFVPYKRPLI